MESCGYCGSLVDEIIACPECMRDGCENCMPAGKSCPCPTCEEEAEETANEED